jgi:hypothetical protein
VKGLVMFAAGLCATRSIVSVLMISFSAGLITSRTDHHFLIILEKCRKSLNPHFMIFFKVCVHEDVKILEKIS